jgi:C4-dicarboxylate-specific signal transduction histidine kinase
MRSPSLPRTAITCRETPPDPPSVPAAAGHLLMIALGYVTICTANRTASQALGENGQRQLELHARTVESEINKYNYLPSVLELESNVSELLNDPSPELRKRSTTTSKA